MLKKTITYKDLDDNDVTEDFYFHYTTGELMEMKISENEGMEEYLKRIIASGDNRVLIREFKAIIEGAVGRRSDDGKHFLKDPVFANGFMHSEAWSALLLELLTDANLAVEFFKGMMPKKLTENPLIDARLKELGVISETEPEKKSDLNASTREELLNMSEEDFQNFMAENKGNLTKEILSVAMHRLNK